MTGTSAPHVAVRRVLEPQDPVGPLEGIDQVAHPGGRDRQRPAARELQAELELRLPDRDLLPRRRLQRLQPRLIVRRP